MKKWTRRAFIGAGVLASGTLVLGIAIRPGNRSSKVADVIARDGESVLNIWLKIAKDNTVTAIIPHAEMGQGVHTALAMMLAEELDADWSQIRFEEAPAIKEYANYAVAKGFLGGGPNVPKFLNETVDGVFLTAVKSMNFQITGGSSSVRFTGQYAMRVAGAAARAMLVQAAAQKWGVNEESIRIEKGIISDSSGKSASFGEIAPEAAKVKKPSDPRLKSEKEFKIIGTSQPRFDIPDKVTGKAMFGIDVDLPNMKYATVAASPVFGGRVKSMDKSMEGKNGVIKVLNLGNAAAVIADGYWQAKMALDSMNLDFDLGENAKINQDQIIARYQREMDEAREKDELDTHYEVGNVGVEFEKAARVIEAEYQVPFLAHATMEPMNCTVWVKGEEAEVWCGSQNPLGVAAAVAEELDIKQEKVKVHNQLLGGGFGRRSENDVILQATRIAREVSYPVKLIWSREEDMQHDVYRELGISRMKAALDESGNPLAYQSQFIFRHHPPEAADIPYAVPNQQIRFSSPASHVPWGNWRSVDHSTHGFYSESFVDEIAHAAKQDPLSYRKTLTSDQPRFQAVLDLVKEKSNWGTELPQNWGRGVAVHKSFGTYVAEVAEVEVDISGGIKVHRVICVADPGFAINPDSFKAQMESGIIYGLSAAVSGEITIRDGAVAQSNFHDYPVTRMKDSPKIETYIINSGNAPGGAGEPSTPIIASAVGNAIFDATGVRLRRLPFQIEMPVRENTLG
ncbi:xanthine dehydrogenase family protein molybdopterin-binding subunit [Algoriphagus sediminis]|uniref:Xanthine dehydrogenase family protein molybdopterin-binding subunit n=1 Tax=Algoriphagus sediminis TaxID=3057113 RepID=A0ABT7YC57_9BACT|nr:xanthine dehydrogenase family protein molybdopterin-binding subunit [Algoriphagus sediminis]MDN3204111.1 xanthine dehydrogenase family protein molybdopterin-binding subunit [Algoriphagus sediminis]